MDKQIEPSYLRYIYDGLIKGSIHPDNAAALPEGLVGLYEEVFDESHSVVKRQQLMKRFAFWAFLKKEVSANFVAEVLGEEESEIINFIATFSKWFNSPESGKYQLYHERLRVFLIQKLSGHEVKAIQEQLIARLEKAIEEKKADEFEYYALQYLSHHLMVEAFANADGKSLLAFTKSEARWDRQILLSNKFAWCKQGLHNAALWTSKHDQEENIFCYLDLVQLHNKEQNDAESIVRLVANNEIDLALERITAFGGLSKQEKERQFFLFMLCLMELTLTESEVRLWRKSAIKRLLKHLENEILIDDINWGIFYSSQIVYLVAIELKKLEVDYEIILKRSSSFDVSWLNEFSILNQIEFSILLDLINIHKDNEYKIEGVTEILCRLLNENRKDDFIKALNLTKINLHDNRLIKAFWEYEGINHLNQLLNSVFLIQDYWSRSLKLNYISMLLIQAEFMDESLYVANLIESPIQKCSIFCSISTKLRHLNSNTLAHKIILESIEISKMINGTEDYSKEFYCKSLLVISEELYCQGRIEKALELYNEAIDIAKRLYNGADLDQRLKVQIIDSLLKCKFDSLAHSILVDLKEEYYLTSLCIYSKNYILLEDKLNILNEAYSFVKNIDTEKDFRRKAKVSYLIKIANEFSGIEINRAKEILYESYSLAQLFINQEIRSESILILVRELRILNFVKEAENILDDLTDTLNLINSEYFKRNLLKKQAEEYVELNQINKAVLSGIEMEAIVLILINNGKIKEAFSLRFKINDLNIKWKVILEMSTLFLINNEYYNGRFIQLEILRISNNNKNNNTDIINQLANNLSVFEQPEYSIILARKYFDSTALVSFYCNLIILYFNKNINGLDELIGETLTIARNISDDFIRVTILCKISSFVFKVGKIELAFSLLNEANIVSQTIDPERGSGASIQAICTEYSNQGYYKVSVNLAKSILGLSFDYELNSMLYSGTLMNISFAQFNHGFLEESEENLNEALKVANGISNVNYFDHCMHLMSDSLTDRGKHGDAFVKIQLISKDFLRDNAISTMIERINEKSSIDKVLNYSYKIIDKAKKENVIQSIVLKMLKLELYIDINKLIYNELSSKNRLKIWSAIGKSYVLNKKKGGLDFSQFTFKSHEEGLNFKIGMTTANDIYCSNFEVAFKFISFCKYNPNSIAEILLKLSLNCIFFQENYPQEKLDKFNKVLNIQWAIDIKNQLPN